MSDRKLGPNTRKLLAHFLALEAVPIGGGLASGLDFLIDPERRQRGVNQAIVNLDTALALVKSAPDNPYGDDDESIADAILQRLEARKVNK